MADSGEEKAERSPDWLPEGWTEQLKVLRSGREARCYINLASKQRFFSKEDVIQYITKGSNCINNLKSNNELIKCVPEKNQKVEETEITKEHPDWLPDGWIIEAKFRMSGVHVGKKYKEYLDPYTGRKFYSKPEVLRYLKTLKSNNCTSQQATGSGMQSSHDDDVKTPTECVIQSETEASRCLENEEDIRSLASERTKPNNTSSAGIVSADEHPEEDLPPGWIKEIIPRKKGNANRSDPFYTDPVSGYVFRSKKDVFRFIETGDISSCKIKPMRRCIASPGFSNDQTSSSSEDKRLQSMEASPSRQLFADKNVSDMSGLSSPKPRSPKRRQSEQISAQNSLSLVAKAKSPMQNAPEEVVNANGTKSDDNSNVGGLALSNSANLNKSKKRNSPNLPRRASKRLAGLEAELAASPASGRKAQQSLTRQSLNNKGTGLGELALSTSKDSVSKQIPTGPEVELIHHASDAIRLKSQVTPEEHTVEVETKHIDGGKQMPQFVSPISNSHSDPCQRAEIPKERTGNDKTRFASETSNVQEKPIARAKVKNRKGVASVLPKIGKKKELKFPNRSLKRLSDSHKEVNLSTEQAIQVGTRNGSKNEAVLFASPTRNIAAAASQNSRAFSGAVLANQVFSDVNGVSLGQSPHWGSKSLERPTVYSVQQQDLGTSKLHNSNPGSTSQLGDSWTDPCLEFAIKTLTGAIPMPDTANLGLVSPSPSDIWKEIPVDGKIDGNSELDSSKSKNKHEFMSPCQGSEQIARAEYGKVGTSSSTEHLIFGMTSNAFNVDAVVPQDHVFNVAAPKFETGPPRMLADEASTQNDIQLQHEASNNSLGHQRQIFSGEQPPNQEMIKMNLEKLDSQLFLPFGEPWYDPCLDFAFKTLTGAIPVDDNLAVKDYLGHQQFSTSQPQMSSGPLPDFGFTSAPQHEMSKDFDVTDKNIFRQQPMNSSYLAPANGNSSGSQQTWPQPNTETNRKVNF